MLVKVLLLFTNRKESSFFFSLNAAVFYCKGGGTEKNFLHQYYQLSKAHLYHYDFNVLPIEI